MGSFFDQERVLPIGVRMLPGQTALTLMLYAHSSSANDCVRPMPPNLEPA